VLFLRRENAYQCEDDRFERDRHGRGKPDSRRVRAAVKQPSSSRQAVRIIIRKSSSLANPRTSSARDGTKSRIHRTDGQKSKETGTEEKRGRRREKESKKCAGCEPPTNCKRRRAARSRECHRVAGTLDAGFASETRGEARSRAVSR